MCRIFRYVVTINHGTGVLFQPITTGTWKWPIHANDCCKKENVARTYSRAAREERIEIFILQVLI
jgi:hypothetical protein